MFNFNRSRTQSRSIRSLSFGSGLSILHSRFCIFIPPPHLNSINLIVYLFIFFVVQGWWTMLILKRKTAWLQNWFWLPSSLLFASLCSNNPQLLLPQPWYVLYHLCMFLLSFYSLYPKNSYPVTCSIFLSITRSHLTF